LADILTIILGVVGETRAFEIGRGGDPNIARAALIQEPRDSTAAGRRNQFRGKWRREHLFQGEGLGRRHRCQQKAGEQRVFHSNQSTPGDLPGVLCF
jgi:hypothetical protein